MPAGALRLAVADEVHARADAMLAGTGALRWERAVRRAQGRVTGEPMGPTPERPFFRLTGGGGIWIAGATDRWLPLRLADDVLYVREDRVLAFEGSLAWEAGVGQGHGRRHVAVSRARRDRAGACRATPIAIKVTADNPTLVSAGAPVRLGRPPGAARLGKRDLGELAAHLPAGLSGRGDRAAGGSRLNMPPSLRRELTNAPNLVTMSRVVLIPFVLVFIDNFSPLRSFIASLLYLLAAAGDALDGYLARSRGEMSTLGKFLDPLADKLMVTADPGLHGRAVARAGLGGGGDHRRATWRSTACAASPRRRG